MRCVVLLFYSFCLHLRFNELLRTGPPKDLRIIGGEDADEDEHPYIVRLCLQFTAREIHLQHLSQDVILCTAEVLTTTWTLTCAHCFRELNSPIYTEIKKFVDYHLVVKYDSWNKNITSNVTSLVPHPAYKMRIRDMINDIALIKHDPIILKKYAQLSGLDYTSLIGHQVTLYGFGITDGTVKLANSTTIKIATDTASLEKPLQMVDALIVPCEKNTEYEIKFGMCLASRCGKLSTLCKGDSGGPVLHSSGIIGVQSTASLESIKMCELKTSVVSHSGAATPVSPYIDWISSTVKN